MTIGRALKYFLVLFMSFAIIVLLISIKHPIILKWLTGSARIVGTPLNAVVYNDGQVRKDIKIYHENKYWNGEHANYYILYFSDTILRRLKVLSLNIKDNYAGVSSSTNLRDYDIVAGLLFQSEVGAHFSQLQDDMKGFSFDPKMTFNDKQIILTIPLTAKELKCDTLRVVL